MSNDLIFKSATDLATMIRNKSISAVELLDAHIEQIEKVNPEVNAIVTYLPEMAQDIAKEADAQLSRGEDVGVLHGLPIAHKDLAETKGIRTTSGSPVFKDHVPDVDALIIERLKQAGCVTLGKTNVPEFGAGSHTFNPLFGATLNPYDTTKSCGGSSGGAAVALATGMIPIADGSDMGGSLRNPASFCNVVGFRPSPGRVPSYPKMRGWNTLSVVGPMARTVEDIALQLQAIAGYDSRSPIAIREPVSVFAKPLERDFKDVKIAWSPNLDSFEVDPTVISTIEKQLSVFTDMGCHIEQTHPDFSNAYDLFQTLRAQGFSSSFTDLFEEHGKDTFKETIQWNAELGQKLTVHDINRADIQRTELYHRVRDFMEIYEFLILPVVQVPPFPVDWEYPKEINGVEMTTYLDWMMACAYITVTGCPAISVPCGFNDDGLPIGLQIVGRPYADFEVLQLAYAFQEATLFYQQQPAIAIN